MYVYQTSADAQRGDVSDSGCHTYISAFSNLFLRLSFMASFVTLLIRVRSETPTSFFLVVSNAAFLILGFELPDAAARPPPGLAALSPFGLLLIPYDGTRVSQMPSVMKLMAADSLPSWKFPLAWDVFFRMRPAR